MPDVPEVREEVEDFIKEIHPLLSTRGTPLSKPHPTNEHGVIIQVLTEAIALAEKLKGAGRLYDVCRSVD